MTADPRLQALRDIHPAPPPDWWPPAPGWWLLALLGLALIVLLTVQTRRFRRRRHRRRLVLDELRRLYRSHREHPRDLCAAFSGLLRRAALARFPRDRVAGLSGEDWLRFLEHTGDAEFTRGPGRALIEATYRPHAEIDGEALHALVRRWLRRNL